MTVTQAVHREPDGRGDGEVEEPIEREEPFAREDKPAKAVSWSLQIVKAERTIFELHRSWEQKVLRLDPDFQREFVWDLRRKVKLVESVLSRIPLPVFYLSEENEDEIIVIDGQQRLTTLFDFMDGKFSLRGLELLPELEGRTFRELDGKLQRRFEYTPLTCFIVQPGTDSDVKFRIFERLNEGAISLNAQEIRNCLFRGKGLDFVKRLAADTSQGSFRDVVGKKRQFNRMRADELVLRGLAFLDLGLEKYPGETRLFLNTELRQLNDNVAQLELLEARWLNALRRTQTVFGEHAFCRYNPANGTWLSSLNGPLLDVIVVGFDRYFPEKTPLPKKKAEKILERFKELCGEGTFRDSITFATHDMKPVKARFDAWMGVLADVA